MTLSPSFSFLLPPFERHNLASSDHDERIDSQPYRTTPLILPGAKAKHDESVKNTTYLRYYPNSTSSNRSPSARQQREAAILKQKLAAQQRQQQYTRANTISVQTVLYNQNRHSSRSPGGGSLLSPVSGTSSSLPGGRQSRETVFYDPTRSPTFQALQEQHGGSRNARSSEQGPVQHRVYTQQRVKSREEANYKLNSMGVPQDKIQQSYTFRKVMSQVL